MGGGLSDRGAAPEGMGGIDGAVVDGGGVIEQLKFYTTTDTSTIVCWPCFAGISRDARKSKDPP